MIILINIDEYMCNDDHTSGWETVSQAAVESLSTERGEKGFHKNAIFPKGKYTTRGFLTHFALEGWGEHIYLPLSRISVYLWKYTY